MPMIDLGQLLSTRRSGLELLIFGFQQLLIGAVASMRWNLHELPSVKVPQSVPEHRPVDLFE